MKITTLCHDNVEKGDRVVIEINGKDEDIIVVGYVNSRDGAFLETTIPYDHKDIRYDLLAVDADGRKIPDRAGDWIEKFNDSRYKLYMEVEVNGSSSINVSGT